MMVDRGASQCFVSESVTYKLKRHIEPTSRFSVTLGNGTCAQSGGVCKNVPLMNDSELFLILLCLFS